MALNKSGPRLVVSLWVASVLVTVATGIGVVYFDLSALPVPLGFMVVDVTVYPPILIGMLLLLWLGPGWAISATYVATFALGAYAGLSLEANLLFSLADPAQLLVVWSGLMVLDVPYEIRSRSNWAFFLALVLTGSVASSLGALVWNYSQQLDFHQGLRIWEGWVVGAFLQGGLLVVPIHHFAGTRVRAWLAHQLRQPVRPNLGPRGGAALLLSAMLLVAAIAVQVGRGFVDSLARIARPEDALATRWPELGLFVALILAAVLGATILFTVALTRRSERERTLARVDSLTGCLNRLAFGEIFAREAERSARLNLPISIVFLDLDHFKSINDIHGYAFGDRVLREMAERVNGAIRGTDFLVRWGGEEFILLLPHTPLEEATQLAERIRLTIRAEPVSRGELRVQVTASLGVVGAEQPSRTLGPLVRRAAEACRAAKLNGRDRVETAQSVHVNRPNHFAAVAAR